MADALQTLATPNGKEAALIQAKNLVDQCAASIAQSQVAKSDSIAEVF